MPCKNTRHTREVPWQPCEWEPALQAATNQHCQSEGASVEKLTWPDTNHEPLSVRGGKGCIGKTGNQNSDSQSSAEQANCKINMVTKAGIHKDQQRRQQQLWRLELMWQNWQLNQFILIIINDFSGDYDGGVASFRQDFVGQQTGP